MFINTNNYSFRSTSFTDSNSNLANQSPKRSSHYLPPQSSLKFGVRDFLFLDNTKIGKSSERKTIRSAVMRGKNRGRTLIRGKKNCPQNSKVQTLPRRPHASEVSVPSNSTNATQSPFATQAPTAMPVTSIP